MIDLEKKYFLFRKGHRVVVAADAIYIASLLKYSKHTVRDWFRGGVAIVDRWEREGFILVRGGEYVKSNRGCNNLKIKKYNW